METEILFLTHEGVEIKMGDVYWYLSNGYGNRITLYHVKVCSWQDYAPAKGFIQFGSEQAAMEYKKEYHANIV